MPERKWIDLNEHYAVLVTEDLTDEEKTALIEYFDWCHDKRKADELGISVEALRALTTPPEPDPKPISGGIVWPPERPVATKGDGHA